MKKFTVISAATAVLFSLSAGAAFAQTQAGVSASSSASAETGGLGTGLTHMVKSILGDDSAPVAAPLSPSAVMMQSAGLQLKSAPAPKAAKPAAQARTLSATVAADSAQPAQQSDADVSAFMGHLLQSDPHLVSMDASDSHARLTYSTSVRLFGLIRIDMPVTGEAYVSGATDVSYPWYASIAGVKSDIKARFDADIAPAINAGGITPEDRIAILGDMYAFFNAEFGAAK